MFRKLSSDLKLLGAFAATFVLAITVAALSPVLENSRLAITALLAAWGGNAIPGSVPLCLSPRPGAN